MILKLFDGWSLFAIVTEHFEDQIFEIIRKGFTTCFLPVLLEFTLKKQVVEVLIFFSFFEWENALDDNEENDTS